MNIHIHVHNEGDNRLQRIEHLLHQLNLKGDQFMATTKEILEQIDAKTTEIAATVTAEAEDLVTIKALIQTLKDGQTDPALATQAQAVLDKLSGTVTSLNTVATDLDATGKDGKV